MDKALCHGTFTIPSDFTPGLYTFQWNWVQGQGVTLDFVRHEKF